MPEPVATAPFRIAPSAYASVVVRQWLRRWWWLVALPPAASLTVAAVSGDVRYLLLAFVLICLVAPLALLFVYYYYALDPRASINLPLHTVACDGVALTIATVAEADDEAAATVATIPLANLCGISHGGGAMRLALAHAVPSPLIIIPYSAFPTTTELRRFAQLLAKAPCNHPHQ